MKKHCKTLHDAFGNMATVSEGRGLPYKGASKRVLEYTLRVYALYDNEKLYHLSIHETLEDALACLNGFSCGTFKEDPAVIK